MEWNTYRAPTDNDQYVSQQWRGAGYDRPTVRVYSVEQEGGALTCHLGICALYIGRFLDVKAVWTVSPDGRVDVSLHGERDTRFPWMPRFGVRLFLPREFGAAEYLPTAPMKAMWTNTGLPAGRLPQSVESMHEDYLKPQENSSLTAAAGM
ncbi:MAG: hypothetical protein ACLU8J_11975 [Acutalibacter sp.]